VDDPALDALLAALAADATDTRPLLVRIGALRRAGPGSDARPWSPALLEAVLSWAVPYSDLDTFMAAIEAVRRRLAELRRDDAALSLATAHSTKGAEFDHVAVVGLDVGRFPSGRAVGTAEDPQRALEEERRLAYVAWTRARRTLTLGYDPAAPSLFMLEAFAPEELGLAEAPD
jgi:superfamily I DNA/RNA helicase